MMFNEVEIDFGRESRNRSNGFKGSKTLVRTKTSRADGKLAKIREESKEHRSKSRNKKRLNLIEDYFYPEVDKISINPSDHTPIIHSDIDEMIKSRDYKSRPTFMALEGIVAFKEIGNASSKYLLNWSIIQTIKKIIKIEEADVVAFNNWDKDAETDYTENIINDIKRSRIRDSTEKESILEDLLLVIVFYWEHNTIVYQQGMQDIFIPFVYLQSKEFSLAEVYAYTKGFIDMLMPNILHSKFNGKDYSLPHLQCQLSLLKNVT